MKRTPLTRASQLKRTRMKRKPPSPQMVTDYRSWVEVTKARANGLCERCGVGPSQRTSGFGPRGPMQAHHLWTRGRAGMPINERWNSAWLDRKCHDEIHFAPVCPDRNEWLASSEVRAKEIRARLDANLSE